MTAPNPFPPSLAGGNRVADLTVDALNTPVLSSLGSLTIQTHVGIGKAATSQPLDVSGNANVSGFLFASNVGIGTSVVTSMLTVAGDVACSGKFMGDGSLLTGISSGGSGVGMFKNAVINGCMRVNQRGITSSPSGIAVSTGSGPTLNVYVADRWCVFRDSFVTGGKCANISMGLSYLPFVDGGVKNYVRIIRQSGNTSTQNLNMRYAFESQSLDSFLGQTVTLSFYYQTGATFSGSQLNCGIVSASANGLQRGATTINTTLSTTVPPSTNWIRASFTTTIPTTTYYYFWGIFFSYTPIGTAGASDYVNITGVQLEKGSVATAFEVLPYTIEMQLCLRYYVQFNINTIFNGMVKTGDNYARVIVPLPASMAGFIPILIYSADAIPNGNFGFTMSTGNEYTCDSDFSYFYHHIAYTYTNPQNIILKAICSTCAESGPAQFYLDDVLGLSCEL